MPKNKIEIKRDSYKNVVRHFWSFFRQDDKHSSYERPYFVSLIPDDLLNCVSDSLTGLIIRLVVFLLGMMVFISVLHFYYKVLFLSCMVHSADVVVAVTMKHPFFRPEESLSWCRRETMAFLMVLVLKEG